jgi:hypothetical protein
VKAGVCALGGAAIIGGGIALLPPAPQHDPITPAIDEPGPAIPSGSPQSAFWPAAYPPGWNTWQAPPVPAHEDHEHRWHKHHPHDQNCTPIDDIDEPPSWLVMIPALLGLIALLWQAKTSRSPKTRAL